LDKFKWIKELPTKASGCWVKEMDSGNKFGLTAAFMKVSGKAIKAVEKGN